MWEAHSHSLPLILNMSQTDEYPTICRSMDAHTYTDSYTHTEASTHTNNRTALHAYAGACTDSQMLHSTWKQTHKHMHGCTWAGAHPHTHTHTHKHALTQACTKRNKHRSSHTHVHAKTHAHTQTHCWPQHFFHSCILLDCFVHPAPHLHRRARYGAVSLTAHSP